jgi:hypothetical protein
MTHVDTNINICHIPFENEHLFENFGSTFWDLSQTFSELF